MEKGKHITLEDVRFLLENCVKSETDEERMFFLLEHLSDCTDCLERVKAHRRLELLLDNWTPALHGLAFQKKEFEQRQRERKLAAKEAAKQEAEGRDAAEEAGHKNCGCGHGHDDDHHCDDDCDCGDDCECDGDDCDCGHDHPHYLN